MVRLLWTMKLCFNRAHQQDGSNGWSEGVGSCHCSMIPWFRPQWDLTEETGENRARWLITRSPLHHKIQQPFLYVGSAQYPYKVLWVPGPEMIGWLQDDYCFSCILGTISQLVPTTRWRCGPQSRWLPKDLLITWTSLEEITRVLPACTTTPGQVGQELANCLILPGNSLMTKKTFKDRV